MGKFTLKFGRSPGQLRCPPVTAIILPYPRLPIARLVGADIAHAVPLTFVAGKLAMVCLSHTRC